MSRNSSQFNKQNELVRSLRKQLEETERELGDQKWLLRQYLQSPSWRLTAPIRWLANLIRPLFGKAQDEADIRADVALRNHPEEETAERSFDLKQIFDEFYRNQLQGFLTTGAALQLPHSETPEVSVILVLYNRAELTLTCLRSLAENYTLQLEIILVDNNSQDETPLLLERLHGAAIIRNTENRNFVLAVNQAAKAARGEYLLLLNNDAQVLPGTLQSALRTIRSEPNIGAVGGRILLLDGTLQEAGSIVWRDGSCLGYGRGDNPVAPMYMFRRDVDYCSGAFLLTRRSVWEELRGFDESFKPAYYEETDYCTRLWERGLRVVYDPNSLVLHYEFASSGSQKDATDLQRDHQRIFAARHQELLATHFTADLNSIVPARMKGQGRKRVLFIDDRVPHTWLGSGFPRARAILLTLLKQQCFVTFYPLSQFDEDWTTVYSDMPADVEFMTGYGPTLLEAFLRNRPGYFDMIFVSRPHNMKILKPLLEAHPTWFEAANIIYDAEAIFVTREITFRRMTGAPFTAEESETLLREEVELAAAADCVVAVSPLDGEQFRKHGIENVRVVGHSLAASPTPRNFDERKGFLFIGAIYEDESPNGDSVIWLLEEIFPKIQQQLGPDVSLAIAGVNKSERVKRLATSNVRITGHLPDLSMLYDTARVFVAPTRYAAGIPHKVHEAAARGLPIVATPLLAEQLGWRDGDPFLVAGDSESFARKCVELYRSRELWTTLRHAGISRIQNECSPQAFEESLRDCLTQRLGQVFSRGH